MTAPARGPGAGTRRLRFRRPGLAVPSPGPVHGGTGRHRRGDPAAPLLKAGPRRPVRRSHPDSINRENGAKETILTQERMRWSKKKKKNQIKSNGKERGWEGARVEGED